MLYFIQQEKSYSTGMGTSTKNSETRRILKNASYFNRKNAEFYSTDSASAKIMAESFSAGLTSFLADLHE